MKKLITIVLLLMVSEAHSAEIFGAELSAYVGGQKVTDASESVQIGLTLKWPYVEVDMSHGIQRVSWRVEQEPTWEMDEWQSGSAFGIRGYPFRNATTIRPLITWVHLSDITRGVPFNDKEEPTSDYFGIGVTFVWKRFELDVSTGVLGRECAMFRCSANSRTSESQIQLRGYFWK